MGNEWDVVIIGGGTAGVSAAQMVARSQRRTLVIDAGAPRNRFADHMHGVLGHDGTAPARLLESGRTEAHRYGVVFGQGNVTELVDEGDRMRVTRDDGAVDTARVVIIATGVRDDLPDIPGLADQWGHTVLHCPYCHGWEVAGQRLAILAISPMSLHQAELVRQLSDDVTVFTHAAEPLSEAAFARLTARQVQIVSDPVREVRGGEGGLVVVTEDGAERGIDAIFTGGTPVIDLTFASGVALERTDAPGAPLAVDAIGATSHPRVFAAGNVVAPFANLPVSMGSGSMAGAGANATLVTEDFDRAVAQRTAARNADWEQRYAGRERFWLGAVNETVADTVAQLRPGTALDIGSGEGGDVIWLAEHGWYATGVDVSATAVQRARELALSRGVDVEFHVGDGAASVSGEFDLVLASFLHSWEPDFPRIRMLRDAVSRVAAGGRLLAVSHAVAPPWAHEMAAHAPRLRPPAEELDLLALDPEVWRPEIVECRTRSTTAPDGTSAQLEDGVLLLLRTR